MSCIETVAAYCPGNRVCRLNKRVVFRAGRRSTTRARRIACTLALTYIQLVTLAMANGSEMLLRLKRWPRAPLKRIRSSRVLTLRWELHNCCMHGICRCREELLCGKRSRSERRPLSSLVCETFFSKGRHEEAVSKPGELFEALAIGVF